MAHLQASGSYNVITTHAPKTLSPEEACQLLRNLRLILRKFISNLHRRAKRLSREIARQKFIETNISPVFKLGRGGIAGKAAHRDAVTYRKVSAGDLGSEPGERPRRRAASAKLASFETEVDVGVDDDSTVYRDFCSLCTAFRQVMTICSVSPPTIQSPSRGLPTLAELAARTLALQLETCAHDARHDRHFRGLAEGDHHGDEFDSATFEEWYHIVPSHSIRHVLPTHAAAIILETLRETSTGIVALRECVGGWLVSCCLDHDRIHEAKIIVQDMMPIWIPIGFATLAVDRKTRIQSGFDLSSICFDCDVQQRLGSFVLDTLINHMQRDGKLQDWVSPQIQDMLNLTFDAGSENISTSTRLLLGALESLVGAENPALDHSQRDIPSTLLSVASDHIRFPVRHMPSGTAKSAYASALARGLGNTALAGHKSFAPLALTMAFVALESSSPIAGNLDPRFEGEGTSDLHYDANGTHVGCEVCQVPNEDQALHEEMVSLLQSLYALDDSLLSKTGRYHSTAEKAETVHARAGFEELQLNGLAKLRLAHVLHLHGCAQAEAEVLASALSSLQDRDWDASGWMHEYEDEERGERIMGTLSALLRSAEARAIEEVQQRWARTTTTSSKATLSDVGRELRRSPRHRQIVDVLTPRMTNPLRREWQFEELIDAWILVTPNAAASRQQNSKTATVMPEAEDATFSPPSSPTSSSYAGSALAYRRARPSCLMPDTPPRTPRQHTRNSGKQAQDTPGPAANLMRSLRKFRAQAPRGSETEVDQSARSRAIESDNMRESVADLKQSSRRLQRIAQPRFSRPLRRIVSEPVTPPSLRIHERDDVFESETDELDLIEIKTPVPPRRRREPARFDVGQQEAKRRASSAVPAPVPAPKRQRLGSGEENAFPSRTRRRS